MSSSLVRAATCEAVEHVEDVTAAGVRYLGEDVVATGVGRDEAAAHSLSLEQRARKGSSVLESELTFRSSETLRRRSPQSRPSLCQLSSADENSHISVTTQQPLTLSNKSMPVWRPIAISVKAASTCSAMTAFDNNYAVAGELLYRKSFQSLLNFNLNNREMVHLPPMQLLQIEQFQDIPPVGNESRSVGMAALCNPIGRLRSGPVKVHE